MIKKAEKVNKFLKKTYPEVHCALNFSDPLELLVATILSAQCTDERVNKVTPLLFKKYKTAVDYASADAEEFMKEIYSTGFYKNKSKNIIAAAQKITEEFNGIVPDEMEKLLSLPGVARKTANIILGTAYGKNKGIAVDTHVKRLSGRIGLTKETDPVKIEKDLMKIIPQSDWTDFSHRLITHGRKICNARKPDCANCGMKVFCDFYNSKSI
ncbi:MAG: endonuclease III [Chlamydiae bacterium]|nr:MAG: endonuclease III [Chlamydiota bacterium]